ncbi:MAG: hypothetical protein LW712_00555, partial [Burkholderiaceae bacterium]|nr:hypothetical protein [Burkholderiaceae bacterium]
MSIRPHEPSPWTAADADEAAARLLPAWLSAQGAWATVKDTATGRYLAADAALALKATTDTYYLHGLVRTATRDYKTAEFDLDKVVEWNPMYEAAYVAQSEVQL